jgi:hypothetical protein
MADLPDDVESLKARLQAAQQGAQDAERALVAEKEKTKELEELLRRRRYLFLLNRSCAMDYLRARAWSTDDTLMIVTVPMLKGILEM